MALQFKRGSNEIRQALVLAAGEPFYVTDYAELGVAPLWIGDGETFGGIASFEINNLDELLDVFVSNPQNNQLLQWNTANGRWQNGSNVTLPGDVNIAGTTTLGDASTDNVYFNARLAYMPDLQRFVREDAAYNSVSNPINTIHTLNQVFAYTGINTGTVTTINGSGMPVLATGTSIRLSRTTGVTGINTTTTYFVFNSTANSMNIASTAANAVSGISVATSGSYSVATAQITVVPSTGIGVGHTYLVQTGPGTFKEGLVQEVVSTNIAAGSESFDYVLTLLQNNTAKQRLKLNSAGQLALGSSADSTSQLAMQTSGSTALITNDAGPGLLSLNWSHGAAAGNRLQFNGTDQWFNTGRLGVATATPAYKLDVNGDARVNNITVGGDGYIYSNTALAMTLTGANIVTAGNLQVTGNLTVTGTTTTVNSTDLQIADNTILLNRNETGAGVTLGTAGVEIERGTATNVSWQWNESLLAWQPRNVASDANLNNVFVGNNLVSGGDFGTNGYRMYMNYADEAFTTGTADLVVRRGTQPDVAIRWDEDLNKWRVSHDGTQFFNLPDQNLSVNSNASFAGLEVTGQADFDGGVDLGNTSADLISVNGTVDTDINFAYGGTLNVVRGIKGTVGNDYWRFGGYAAASDIGIAEIATGDNGTEPVVVRQYAGTTVQNEIYLLTADGDTQLNDVIADSINVDTITQQGRVTRSSIGLTQNGTGAGQPILSFSSTLHRTAKLLVQYQFGGNYQTVELLVIHNGTTAFLTASNEIIIGTAIATAFDASISAGTVNITATLVSGTGKDMKVEYTLINV